MFFAKEGLCPDLQQVLYFEYPAVRMANTLQHYAALSVRLESDTTITIGGERHRLVGENVCYFPPDTPYVRDSRIDRMIVFHFTMPPPVPAEFFTFTPHSFAPVADLARTAYAIYRARARGYHYRASACFFELLALLQDAYADAARPDPTEEAVRYIARHLTEAELCVRAVARAAFVSEVHLRTLFHRRFGCSPKEYLLREKLTYARSLLESGFYTVAECARRAGFADVRGFATIMKRETGKTPSAWKRG